MINARSETVREKPAFRDSFAHRRCLIPADGYYEWLTQGKEKLPYLYEFDNGKLFSEMKGQLDYHPEWWRYYGGLADKLDPLGHLGLRHHL